MDQKSGDRDASVVIGAGLVILGVFFLLNQLFNFDFLGELWPLIVVFVGLLFLGGMFVGGGARGQWAVPGSMITIDRADHACNERHEPLGGLGLRLGADLARRIWNWACYKRNPK